MSLITLVPATFVFIWSTGWIMARYIAPHGDPLTFLSVRYAAAFVVASALALIGRAAWPRTRSTIVHAMVSGVLLHAIYLGGVWVAVRMGVPAGISALVAALQPLMAGVFATAFGMERLRMVQICGIAVGLAGVLAVIGPKLAAAGPQLGHMGWALAINVVGMVAVTLGTFYQKRFIPQGDFRSVIALQYIGALIVTLPAAYLLEEMHIDWRYETYAGLAWSVLVLSIGAILLMLLMIRRGEVSKVSALIYLVPPTAALQAWFMFGETLTWPQVLGMAVTAFGVYLVTRPAAPPIANPSTKEPLP
jgi:drug/metabolite transporter (DMT)-like permease